MPVPNQTELRNAVLAQLSAGDQATIRGHIDRVTMQSGDILQASGEAAKSIFFIESGIVSLLAPLEQGGRLEVGHIGREGVAGVHAALGAETLNTEIMAQGEGVLLRVDAATIRGLMEQSPALRRGLMRFANALHAQVAQTAACNGAHEVVQRLARWLLMVHDRTDGDTLNLTHELISLMLGVTRPGVTIAAGALQKSGLIQYSRGRLTIIDRAGLEVAACECYHIVAQYYRSELA